MDLATNLIMILSILPITPDPQIEQFPMAPWVQPGDITWQEGPAIFDISDGASGTSARGWLAVDNDNIHLRVVVKDDKHINNKENAEIWQGDAIQVGISAYGETSRRGAYVGPNDAALAFALTSSGPASWAYFHGRPDATGSMDAVTTNIRRDDDAQTTTYDITMPWSEFQAQPAGSPLIALTVQINDSDDDTDRQARMSFGDGAGGRPSPSQFEKIRIGPPPQPVLAARVTRDALWQTGDFGEIILAVAGQPELTVRARFGEQVEELKIPAEDASAGLRRFAIRSTARQLPKVPTPLEVTVLDAEGKELLSTSHTLQTGQHVVDQMNDKIDALVAESPHPLFTHHLRTVQAVANIEWQVAKSQMHESTALAEDALRNIRQIVNGLEGDASKWETYRDRRRKLAVGFINPSDRTLQFSMVLLPRGFEDDKTYPAIVFLHGGGTSHVPLDIAATPFASRESREPVERFEGDFGFIYMEPYARGRYGYRDIAERDVHLAVDDAIERLNADPDHIALAGFSMGGHGAWAVAAHSPDRWSAVCVNAGGDNLAPTSLGMARNFLGLPIRISHGNQDRAVPFEQGVRLHEALTEAGVEHDFIVLEGVGHDYYEKPFEGENLAWLAQHRRQRPDHFAFTADTAGVVSRNGITLRRDPSVTHTPWFECRIEGNQVQLTSEGTPTLDVNLGRGGLGLEGDVVVTHNGQTVYEGASQSIRIDTAANTARPFVDRGRRRGR